MASPNTLKIRNSAARSKARYLHVTGFHDFGDFKTGHRSQRERSQAKLRQHARRAGLHTKRRGQRLQGVL